MLKPQQPLIKDLALIGDKRTCAFIDTKGNVVWHCPWRFDQPSVFSLLIDEHGGYWSIQSDEANHFKQRNYRGNTAILESIFEIKNQPFTVTDFMPFGRGIRGLCRMFSGAPVSFTSVLFLKPDYGKATASFKKGKTANTLHVKGHELFIKASHPLVIENDCVMMQVPAGEASWAVLLDDDTHLDSLSLHHLKEALEHTATEWGKIMEQLDYEGPYQKEMHQSYKAIQLMTHDVSGGILAAGTTSLPEVIGSSRNYDYRYVWLRDTAMVVTALIRANSAGDEAERFLDFLQVGKTTNKKNLFVPFYDLDAKAAFDEREIPGTGYQNSRPLRTGNGAFEQEQLDAQGNVILAAKQIYGKNNGKPHWENVVHTAEYIVNNWQRKDHGIWEEGLKEHYTSSKVLAAISLEFLSDYAETEKQKEHWLKAANDIREFVGNECITSDGCYAVFAGSDEVDITSALYPIWWFCKANTVEMQRTIQRLEINYRSGNLYHRHLCESDWKEEGVFLAASLWMAQYYVLLGNFETAKTIIDAVLEFATDLGLLPEEGDVKTGAFLGNIPQTFVHSSFIGVVLDYKEAINTKGTAG